MLRAANNQISTRHPNMFLVLGTAAQMKVSSLLTVLLGSPVAHQAQSLPRSIPWLCNDLSTLRQ